MAQNRITKAIIGGLIGIAVFSVTSYLLKDHFLEKSTFDNELMKVASELNKTCPIMVDAETRLDNAVALPPNKFQYNYTLVNMAVADIDTIQFHQNLDQVIINNVRTNPQLKVFRDRKVTMSYFYKDKDGNYLMRLDVTPELYN